MAVKYVRDGYRKQTEREPRDTMPGIGGLKKTKQRLLMVYLGVGVLASMILIFQLMEMGGSFGGRTLEQGQARIVGKVVTEESGGNMRYYLDLRVELANADPGEMVSGDPAATVIDDRVEVSEAAWQSFGEGEAVLVSYKIDRKRARLTVQTLLSDSLDAGNE